MLVAEAATSQLRVLVVDEREIARLGLRYVLSRAPWVARVAAAASADEALLLVRAVTFDVVLVDVDLGFGACERLQAAVPGLCTALLTSRWDQVSLRSARAVGAHGAIAKDQPAAGLLRAVPAAAATTSSSACRSTARARS